MTWCRGQPTVAALADTHWVINKPKAKRERIAFRSNEHSSLFDVR
jgi:hypothetical protein